MACYLKPFSLCAATFCLTLRTKRDVWLCSSFKARQCSQTFLSAVFMLSRVLFPCNASAESLFFFSKTPLERGNGRADISRTPYWKPQVDVWAPSCSSQKKKKENTGELKKEELRQLEWWKFSFVFRAVWRELELNKLNEGTGLAGLERMKRDEGVLQIVPDCDVSFDTSDRHSEAAPLFFIPLSASSVFSPLCQE